MTLAAIDWDALLELVWAAPLAGVGVSVLFSLVILGVARAGDARRERADGLALAYGAMAAVAGLASAGCVAYGLSIILR
jgi:hypothetical protein